MSHKYLLGLLPVEGDEPVDFEGKLQLEYYKLEKTFEGEIKLNEDKNKYDAMMSALAGVMYREMRQHSVTP